MPTTIITPDRTAMRRANLQPGGVLGIARGSHTGDAVLTTCATVTVPGGIMGPSGIALIRFAFTINSVPSAAYTIRVEFDGTAVFTRSMATNRRQHLNNRIVANQGVEDSQSFHNAGAGLNDTGEVVAGSTASVDTSHDFDITALAQLDAADTASVITCEYLSVKILGITGE